MSFEIGLNSWKTVFIGYYIYLSLIFTTINSVQGQYNGSDIMSVISLYFIASRPSST